MKNKAWIEQSLNGIEIRDVFIDDFYLFQKINPQIKILEWFPFTFRIFISDSNNLSRKEIIDLCQNFLNNHVNNNRK